jgi:CRISPR-associated protein Cas1
MKSKTVKIVLDSFGSFLGREKGCLVVKNREGKLKRYPLFENEIDEIRVSSGNTVSSGALATCGFWHIDCLIVTRWGNPIATVRSLCDDSHVETRICQYEALKNGKGLDIAKQTVIAKLQGQNEVLKKYGLKALDVFGYSRNIKALEGDLNLVRNRLMSYEGKFSEQYFKQFFQLFGELFRPEKRKTYKAYDAINNVLNLAYSVLKWKVQIALLKAKLEPYLGFLHHVQFGKPSLICDFEELYRFLIDDFVIGFCRDLKNRDFILKTDNYAGKKDKRQYLSDSKRRDFLRNLDRYFETKVSIARIRRGRKQELETLINEEALSFASYLRNERQSWNPRIVELF